jgi:hypothetical protein
MTPQEQIASVRANSVYPFARLSTRSLLAVCDLAERGLLDDDEAEAVRAAIEILRDYMSPEWLTVYAVLRRLIRE